MEELIQSKEEKAEELYDIVCLSEVIEHVNDQKSFIENAVKLVKPETGLFFLSSIAKTPEAYFTNIILGEYILGFLPKGTHEY